MSNEKRGYPGCLGVYRDGAKNYPVFLGDYFINHAIRITIKQPVFWHILAFFFVAFMGLEGAEFPDADLKGWLLSCIENR